MGDRLNNPAALCSVSSCLECATRADENNRTGLKDPSALLRHEVAYCLGQRQEATSVELLSGLLANPQEHPMVRHEAGEALGAIGTPECLIILHEHQGDACREVAQTCQLALQRIEFFGSSAAETYSDNSAYLSVDPAPALPADVPSLKLRNILLDESKDIFQRYRALFALRNAGGEEAVKTLAASFQGSSALLKHEVAYVLGQMQHKLAVQILRQVMSDSKEDAMVRHEAAEALGSIADPECKEILHKFTLDREPIVADSCLVALDMLDSGQ